MQSNDTNNKNELRNLETQILYGINRKIAIKWPEKVTAVQEHRSTYKWIQDLRSYLNRVNKTESVLTMYCKKLSMCFLRPRLE